MLYKCEMDDDECYSGGWLSCCGVAPYALCIGPLFVLSVAFVAVGCTYNSIDMHLLGLTFLVWGAIALVPVLIGLSLWLYYFYSYLWQGILVTALLRNALVGLMVEGWCQQIGMVVVFMVRGGREQFDLGSFGAGAAFVYPLALFALCIYRMYQRQSAVAYSNL